MERNPSETWVTSQKQLIATHVRDACLIHIYPINPSIGTRYQLRTDASNMIGRGEECGIQANDFSVSRRHARIEYLPDGFHVIDLQSTNGTYVNDTKITEGKLLGDADYLRIGNCIFRFLSSGNVEAEYHEEIYRLTIVDALTQVHNNRYLMESLEREVLRTNRHQRPLAVILLDIDRFKRINDQLGHLGGDFVLRELAAMIRGLTRREDIFARYGGEEFCLLLIECTLKQALETVERIRAAVEAYPFRFEDQIVEITISMGVARCTLDGRATGRELLRVADENLYRAKHSGRNRVVG